VRVLSSAQRTEVVYAESSNFDAELTAQTTALAIADAGITPGDLDVIELHDAFSVEEIFYLEAMGIAKPGEARPCCVPVRSISAAMSPSAPLAGCWRWDTRLVRRALVKSSKSRANSGCGNTRTRGLDSHTWSVSGGVRRARARRSLTRS
jgi:hypothetical protein